VGRFLVFAFAALMLLLGVEDANARRRGIPIPIPSFSTPETLVHVQELPKRAPFIRKDGSQIDLGYLWSRSGDGQWVGYLSDSSYLKWTPDELQMVQLLGGLKELPPVPERPTDLSAVGGWGGIFWLGVVALVLLVKFGKQFMPGSGDVVARLQGRDQPVAAAAGEPPATTVPPNRTSRIVPTSAGQRPSFGRR
jgi:hypothetical protein